MTVATNYTALTLDMADGVAALRLTEADRGNPFDPRFCTELGHAATVCATRRDVRCVLIEAEGRFFSVGGDLRSMGNDGDEFADFISQATVGLHMAVARFARMDAPLVVAVHAPAAGAGVSITALADFAIASRNARFYAAYTGIGLAVDGGASHYLPRRVGSRRAKSFYLRNETWSAEQALEYGLVDEVVEDDALPEAARALAAELAAGPTKAFGHVRDLLANTWTTSLETQLEAEARAMVRTGRTADAPAAMAAVAAKEKPVFRGR